MSLMTIGFTKKSARRFFEALQTAGVKRVADVRLNNVSQLAGFAKRNDLEYFLRTICGIDHLHLPDLAPTQEMLDAFKKRGGSWQEYEDRFLDLMARRRIEKTITRELLEDGCLLCSEHEPPGRTAREARVTSRIPLSANAAYVGIDVAFAKNKLLPVCICTRQNERLLPLPLGRRDRRPPHGNGNPAALDPAVVDQFATNVRTHI